LELSVVVLFFRPLPSLYSLSNLLSSSGGRTVFLGRNAKLRQDGYDWGREKRSVYKSKYLSFSVQILKLSAF
jgi:hypothetical protein